MLRTVRSFALLVSLLVSFGCGSDVQPADPSLVQSERSLVDVGYMTGVTVDEHGQLFVLTRDGVLMEEVDGAWTIRFRARTGATFEDVVSLGEGRFALTTIDMGFELDVATGELTQHFCYLPDDDIREEDPPQTPIPTSELARAVTFDHETGLLYAQPQTVQQTDGLGTFSEVASFDRVTGTELEFRNLGDASFSAGGMVVLGRGEAGTTLLAADGSMLHTIVFETGAKRAVLDLSSLGIEDVAGMAIDSGRGVLHVLDQRGTRPMHIALDLALLRAEL